MRPLYEPDNIGGVDLKEDIVWQEITIPGWYREFHIIRHSGYEWIKTTYYRLLLPVVTFLIKIVDKHDK